MWADGLPTLGFDRICLLVQTCKWAFSDRFFRALAQLSSRASLQPAAFSVLPGNLPLRIVASYDEKTRSCHRQYGHVHEEAWLHAQSNRCQPE